MKWIVPLLLIITHTAAAQTADFIVLKKRNHTIQTFFAGSNIQFTTTSGTYIDALINGIKDDTLYLQQFVIQYLPTTFGTLMRDTAGSYHYKFHYNQVAAIGKTAKRGFDTKSNGAILFGGGILLTVASGVVYFVDRKHFSAPLLIGSAALGTIGYFLAKGGSSGMAIGKKYHLQYVNMSNNTH
ncbi:MAG: hypothetical protein JST86_00505 [Bacteroidetes bacterium]|nr:hypothetical protein [Bacteroidota bacterium]